MAHVLFAEFIKTSPANPKWLNRDRFVLSNGHACVLQYIYWHFLGFNISMDDLKNFRQMGSKYALLCNDVGRLDIQKQTMETMELRFLLGR